MKTAITLGLVLLLAGSGVVLHANRPPPVLEGVSRKDLQRHDLAITGREVVQTEVTLAPGVLAPRHWHPGEEIVYMLEGELEYVIDGQPPVTLKPGEVLFIPAGAVHSARNVGKGDGTELATYLLEKGKPAFVLAQ
jgi:quercetin dioxygenase-like cupin family protein